MNHSIKPGTELPLLPVFPFSFLPPKGVPTEGIDMIGRVGEENTKHDFFLEICPNSFLVCPPPRPGKSALADEIHGTKSIAFQSDPDTLRFKPLPPPPRDKCFFVYQTTERRGRALSLLIICFFFFPQPLFFPFSPSPQKRFILFKSVGMHGRENSLPPVEPKFSSCGYWPTLALLHVCSCPPL